MPNHVPMLRIRPFSSYAPIWPFTNLAWADISVRIQEEMYPTGLPLTFYS